MIGRCQQLQLTRALKQMMESGRRRTHGIEVPTQNFVRGFASELGEYS